MHFLPKQISSCWIHALMCHNLRDPLNTKQTLNSIMARAVFLLSVFMGRLTTSSLHVHAETHTHTHTDTVEVIKASGAKLMYIELISHTLTLCQ